MSPVAVVAVVGAAIVKAAQVRAIVMNSKSRPPYKKLVALGLVKGAR